MPETRIYRCRDCGRTARSGEWPVNPRQGTVYCPACLVIPDLIHRPPAQARLFPDPEPAGPYGRGGAA